MIFSGRKKIRIDGDEREGDKITLKSSQQGSWFILRTHGEDIADIKGGSQTKIEDNAYLIYTEDTIVEIMLKEPGLYYDTRND